MSKTAKTTHDQAVDQDAFETIWPGPDARLDDHDDHLAYLDSETHALRQAVDRNSQCIEALKAGAVAFLVLRKADCQRIQALESQLADAYKLNENQARLMARIEAIEARLAQTESHALAFGETVARLQNCFGEQVRKAQQMRAALEPIFRLLNQRQRTLQFWGR